LIVICGDSSQVKPAAHTYDIAPLENATTAENGIKIKMVDNGKNNRAAKNDRLGSTRSAYRAGTTDLVMELEYAHDLF